MSFINPYLLWGSLAVAIPILIHFWHQKQGTVLPWAATQWLVEKNQQQQRGVKFDNLLVLIIRSLLVMLLTLLLSQPIADWFRKGEAIQPVHLIQPDARLVDNFRFELETALKKGEKLYWATAEPELLTTLALPRQADEFTAVGLQGAVDKLPKNNALLHLYVLNTQHLADVPFVYVPAHFRLHALVDSARGQRRFLATKQTKLFVNGANRLTSGPTLPTTIRFASAAVREGALSVLIRFRDKTERQTVGAALNALTDVYKLDLSVADQSIAGQQYDVVLTDQLPTKPSPKTLYIVSGTEQASLTANVIPVSGPFTPQSDRVAGGQLPEWLGEQFITYFGLNPGALPLSQQQLNALFVGSKERGATPTDRRSTQTIHEGLLLVFVLLIGVERWLALTKNA